MKALSLFVTLFIPTLLQAADLPLTQAAGPERPDAVFDADPGHLWNRLHHALFVRTIKGKSIGQGLVDPPLWADTKSHLLQGLSHQGAITLLDELLAGAPEHEMRDPLKRLVMQHDLWSVFDWTANRNSAFASPTSDRLPDEDASTAARKALRERLAAAIRRLALSPAELEGLSDNYQQAVSANTYRDAYAPKHPERPFLPSDLMDADGTWICVRGAAEGPAAPIHASYYRGRSAFTVYIRLPDGQLATQRYIAALNQSMQTDTAGFNPTQFPVGTSLALVRKMFAISASGEVMLTPIVQTVQMRVYREVGSELKDHKKSQAMYKFKLDRAALFAGQSGGLVPVSRSEPLVRSILNDHEKDYLGGGQSFMTSCFNCHSCGGGTAKGLFTFDQSSWVYYSGLSDREQRLYPVSAAKEELRTRAWKQGRHDWQLLNTWMDVDRTRLAAGSNESRTFR